MGVSIPDWARRLRAQVAELTLDLGIHVERRLAAADAALISSLHELADLVPESLVHGRRRARHQGCHLGINVERRLPARLPPGRLRLHELADLLCRFGTSRRAVRRRPRGLIAV